MSSGPPVSGYPRRPESLGRATDLTLLHNRLVSICREMGVATMKTAYSPVFNEGFDFVCALFDSEGRMIAQAQYNPSMLGAANFAVRAVLEEIGTQSFAPGDVWIHNDPYRGGCHLPEHMVMRGIFAGEELVAFAAAIGHVAEIGGRAVGGLAGDATDIYQEGLRLPPVRLLAAGEEVRDVWKILLTNHRTPKLTWGDVHALMGALTIAERRVSALYLERGLVATRDDTEELMERAEAWMRREIAEIPAGEYCFSDVMENDGITADPYTIRARVTVREHEVIADFTGTDRQARGPINATYAVTAAATYNAIFQLTDSDIPRNAGCYRPIRIIAPPGSLVNVVHPGAEVGGNSETHCRIIGVVLGALAAALPDRAVAADGGTGCNFVFGGFAPQTGEPYANYHFENVGWGAAAGHDGNDAQCAPLAISRNVPVEVFDTRYPLRTESLRLATDSGGAGRQRGGLGTERIFRVLAPEITVGALFDRALVAPWGLAGGLPGGTASIEICRTGEERFRSFTEAYGTLSPTKFSNITVHAGDLIRIVSSGGGGYGNPADRPAKVVQRDVRNRYVSAALARELYGADPDSEAQSVTLASEAVLR